MRMGRNSIEIQCASFCFVEKIRPAKSTVVRCLTYTDFMSELISIDYDHVDGPTGLKWVSF